MVSIRQKAPTELIPDTVDYTKDTGTYYVHDVYAGFGLKGIPRGEAKTLRVVEIDYRAAPVGEKTNGGPGGGSMNSTPVSIGNATWDVKRILGDAEIHEDGSVRVDVPAMVSQYHQVLNAKGQVIQTTRTWDTIRPGEQKSCMGCHVKEDANFYPYEEKDTIAWTREPQKLKPFYGESRGFSFKKEVQPILDRNCIDCHDGNDDCIDLRGIAVDGANKNKRKWTRSYLNLTEAERDDRGSYFKRKPEEGIVSWINMMSRPTEIPPYFAGSAKSYLVKMLEDGHYDVQLAEEDLHKIYAWIDLLVPFSGDHREGHAWSDDEMAFYDYYENKRKAQHVEEAQNIVDYLAQSAKHPLECDNSAPFTRGYYRSLFTETTLSPNHQGHYRFAGEAALLETLTLRNEATERVHVRVRDIDSDKTHRGADIQPGETVTMRFHIPIHTGNSYIESKADGVNLTIVEALGVRFEELPSNAGYRRHRYALDNKK